MSAQKVEIQDETYRCITTHDRLYGKKLESINWMNYLKERWLRIAEFIQKKEKKAIFLIYSENGYTEGTKEKLIKNGMKIIKK